MTAASFQVALTGLKDGHAPEDVAHRLARLFTQPPEKMLAILDGKRRILKKGLNETDARKYEAALLGAGCNCAISTLPDRSVTATGRETRDVAAATDAALAGLAARAEQHRARQAELAQADIAAGQRLAIDALILHGIYFIVQKHLGSLGSFIAWLPVVAVMVASMLRLCRGLGYKQNQRNALVTVMLVPFGSLLILITLCNRAGRTQRS